MLAEAAQHLRTETSLERIHFVLFDDRARDTFERIWEKLQRELPAGAAGA
jgi:hypothetical protein